MIQIFGIERGIKIGFVASIFTAIFAAVMQRRLYVERERTESSSKVSINDLWKTMNTSLKRLLAADVFARVSSNMISVYVVLYVLNILEASPLHYGFMISTQMTTSILSYIPAAKLSDIYGRKPFVTATFLLFALFPVTLVLVPNASLLPLAFIVSGLREMGEPARKALIVDLAEEKYRGKTIGLYYLIRGITNISAPLIGGLMWSISPRFPFYLAFIIGIIGVLIFHRFAVS